MEGYRHCTTESAASRQRQFEAALLESMLQGDYETITVKDLCDAMGTSRKAFYHYFGSKEACLLALVDHTLLGFSEPSGWQRKPQLLLEGFFAYWLTQQTLLDALQRNRLESILMVRAMICVETEYGLRREQKQSAAAVRSQFIMGGLISVLLCWHASGCSKSPGLLAQELAPVLAVPR